LEIETNNQLFRFVPKDSHESLEVLNNNMSSKVNLISRNDAVKEHEKVKLEDMQIRKYRRSQERIKSLHERNLIRSHKKKNQMVAISQKEPIILKSTIEEIDPDFMQQKYAENSQLAVKPKQVQLKSDLDDHRKVIRESCSLESTNGFKKAGSNDYGVILSQKYVGNKIKHSVFSSKLKLKPSTESNSPIKRWNRQAKVESQGRIQLMSHVCYF